MDKKRLKFALAVLDAVKSRFLETQEFIDSTLKEESEKKGMTADYFFASKLAKKKKQKNSLDKNFCFRFIFGTIVFIFLFIDVERLGRW